MAERPPFVAVYYSDGSYEAHYKFRAPANDNEQKQAEPVYGYVFDDEPTKGAWDTSDGFFALQKDGNKTYVGTISFGPTEWEGGQKGREWSDEKGNKFATGPALFRGLNYDGKPGGKNVCLTRTLYGGRNTLGSPVFK